MDLAKILRQLHEELANLDAAIISLEKLQESGRRRGRPPAWLSDVNLENPAKPRRKPRRQPPDEESP